MTGRHRHPRQHRRLITILVLTGSAAILAVSAAPAVHATPATRHAARQAPVVFRWRTCRPRALLADTTPPGYRLDNDVFDGYQGQYCLTGRTDRSFQIMDNARPDGGKVVAYPKVYVGQNYNAADPWSFLPLKATSLGPLSLRVESSGHAPGQWTSDVDSWLWNTSSTTGHGAYEIVIITRQSGQPRRIGHLIRIGGRDWWYDPWITTQTYLMNGRWITRSWPLIWFEAAANTSRTVTVDLPGFVRHAITTGWLPKRAWLGQIGYGSEIWSGGKNLRDAMSVHYYAVVLPPGGGAR
jgi:hypothetical protein